MSEIPKDRVNKIPEDPKFEGGPQAYYRMVVYDENENILYNERSRGGILMSVEKVKEFGLNVEATHQFIAWGHPFIQMYAYDQAVKALENVLPKVLKEAERMGLINMAGMTMEEFLKKMRHGKK